MTTIAAGGSVTLGLSKGGSVLIVTGGGFGFIRETAASGGVTTTNFGQAPFREMFGPYSEATSVVITNTSCPSLDYDADVGRLDPSSVAITGGVIGGVAVAKVASASNRPLTLDLAPSSDVPTITYPASTGWGASAIACTDSRFTYWGGVAIQPNLASFGQMSSKSTSGESFQPFFTEYGFDGTTLVIRAGVDANKTKWLLWVDSKLAKADADYYVGTVGTVDITITFAAKKLGGRVLTFLSTWGHHKITAGAATDTVYQVTRSKGRRVALIGDSWGRTNSDFLDGVFYPLAMSLGYFDIVPSMQGGTGYYNPGPAGDGRRNFVDRFADEVAPAGCTDFIVGGSINDLPSALPGVSRALVQANITSLYRTIISNSPAARIFAFGVQYVNPTQLASYPSLDAELQAAIVGLPVTMVSTSGWLTGTGKAGATVGDGNRDLYRATDGDHLVSPDGIRYWAQRVRQAFVAAGGF